MCHQAPTLHETAIKGAEGSNEDTFSLINQLSDSGSGTDKKCQQFWDFLSKEDNGSINLLVCFSLINHSNSLQGMSQSLNNHIGSELLLLKL